MSLFHSLAFPLLVTLAACATAPQPAPGPSVYVMRHLQKDAGTDPGLSPQGRANAERLVAFFAKDPPAAIYVSTTRRARETAAPLAARLHLTPKPYDPRDTAGLVARVKAETGTVLVVGHSNTVPAIVASLGGTRPADLAETDFGDVFRVGRDGHVDHLSLDRAAREGEKEPRRGE
jgi:broad specificity phosphatase PhoE